MLDVGLVADRPVRTHQRPEDLGATKVDPDVNVPLGVFHSGSRGDQTVRTTLAPRPAGRSGLRPRDLTISSASSCPARTVVKGDSHSETGTARGSRWRAMGAAPG